MSEKKDFDYGICKIQRVDKDGKDITGDKIGKGGRHRDDGTYSGPVFDVEQVDYDPSQQRVEYRDRYHEVPVYVQPSIGKQLLGDFISRTVNGVIDSAVDAGKQYVSDRLYERRQRKEDERRARLEAERQARIAARAQPAETVSHSPATPLNAEQSLPAEFVAKYDHYTINMTSKEAKKELLEAYVLHLMSVKKLWKVAHSNVSDDNGQVISGKELIDKFCSPEIIGEINKILQYNPDLLESLAARTLEDILGRELVLEERYVPIEEQALKERLMAIPA